MSERKGSQKVLKIFVTFHYRENLLLLFIQWMNQNRFRNVYTLWQKRSKNKWFPLTFKMKDIFIKNEIKEYEIINITFVPWFTFMVYFTFSYFVKYKPNSNDTFLNDRNSDFIPSTWDCLSNSHMQAMNTKDLGKR